MRKTVLLTFVTLIAFLSRGQFGIQIGLCIADQYLKFNASKVDPKAKTGFSAGMTYHLQTQKLFFLRTAINYSLKGSKIPVKVTDPTNPYNPPKDQYINSSLSYLEIPILAGMNKTGKKINFILGLGPIVSFGISGKNSSYDYYQNPYTHDPFKDTLTALRYKRIDFGGRLMVGFKISNVEFNVGYSNGFQDINKSNTDVLKNKSFELSLIYWFDKRND